MTALCPQQSFFFVSIVTENHNRDALAWRTARQSVSHRINAAGLSCLEAMIRLIRRL
jgi:hypothetical protein